MAALAALVALSGCAPADPGSNAIGRSEHAISGSNATIDDYGFDNEWIKSVGWLDINQIPCPKVTVGGITEPVPGVVCGPGLSCTGTLVSPDTVLTAGHCFDGADSSNLGTFTIPDQPPVNGIPTGQVTKKNRSGKRYRIAAFYRINNASDKPHDIALAVLLDPVPNFVISHYLPILTGDPYHESQVPTVFLPGYIAGFGGTNPSSNDDKPEPEDGHRRYGPAPPHVHVNKDPCDKGPLEGPCNNDWQWEANRIANPQTEEGDSGGPLILTTTEPDLHLVIAGVDSGWVQDAFGTARTVWAPTGNPGGTDNGKWIFDALGGDADGDGIPDFADNCPAWRCQDDPARCYNPDQADLDGDGVGDKCDNCPPAWCNYVNSRYPGGQVPGGITCTNPSQTDSDHDGLGDLCDLCPNNGADAANPAADADGDGVGDVCDKCDQPDQYQGCTTDADCNQHNGVCLKEPGTPGGGRCSKENDSDDDGVPDACDQCPGVKTLDRTNSNDIAEQREHDLDPSVRTLADPCDAVPLERFKEQDPEKLDPQAISQLTPFDEQGPDDIVGIDENQWLGKDVDYPSVKTTLKRRVAYRYCTCIGLNGEHRPLDKCVGEASASIICPDNMPLSDGHWKIPTIVDSTGFPLLDATGTTALSWGLEAFETAAALSPHTVYWRWRDDFAKGVEHQGNCALGGPLDCTTYGAMLTRTVKAAPYASTREQNHTLGDVFGLITTPAADRVPSYPGTPSQPGTHGAPVAWVTPDFQPDPPYLGFTNMFPRPAPIAKQPSGGIAAFISPDRTLDVTSYFDDFTRSVVGSGALWLSAVEPFDVARYSASIDVQLGIHAVALARDFTGQPPVPIAITSDGVRFGFTSGDAVDPPPVLHDVRGAYSAVEGNIFMVGGTLDSGLPGNGIWRYSLDSGQWHLVDIGGPYVPSSRVLSVGYDISGRHLYVLDVDDNDVRQPQQRYARLYRIDLDQQTSTLLALFHYHDTGDVDAIAVMPDGMLALVKGHGQAFSVWRLDGRGARADFRGVLPGSGEVLDGPVMGKDRLYLPVKREGRIDVVALGSERFHGGASCKSL